MARLRPLLSYLVGVPFAVAYGVLARLAFGSAISSDVLGTISVAFLLLVPAGVGALAVALMPPAQRTLWGPALAAAVGACLIATLVVGLLAFEALICILMAAPFLVAGAAVGGALACWAARRRARERGALLGLLALPFLLGPAESRLPPPESRGVAATQILIRADAQTVWATLVEVPPIAPAERSPSLLFDLLGAPRPLAATLERPGLGGLRRGHFEQGLEFDERIVAWEPGRRIAWEIQIADRAAVAAPWSQIGGPTFDVTGASYWIEPIADDAVILHLDSRYRLASRFNDYGGLWARWGLAEFQGEVLRVIRARAER